MTRVCQDLFNPKGIRTVAGTGRRGKFEKLSLGAIVAVAAFRLGAFDLEGDIDERAT